MESSVQAKTSEVVLEVSDLQAVFWSRRARIYAANGVSFHLNRGEVLGVVGESGSGKSVTMMSIVKLLPTPPAEIVSGSVRLGGRDLLLLDADEMRMVRGGEVGFVFQDPMTSLNPVFTVGYQLMEPLRKHLGLGKAVARKRAIELLSLVGIPSPQDRINDYPHHFSGGMRQRVMIAIALACDPKVLIADEPTTALDVTIQAQILELVKKLRQEIGMSIIWITHDLGVVAGIADRVMVMYGGLIVETAAVDDLYTNPRHPYTRALLETLPRVDMAGQER
ncbi:ABC transporter ATP-binding protein, partial [Mesorhizobium sp. M4A.F.Ca.ET.022.05.2.1]